MNIKQNLYITKFLFFISIILSIGTFFNQKNGGSEIYPFYHWKLFSQPLGNYYTFDSYRIYGITTNNDTVRMPNIGYKNLSQDDYYYFVGAEANKIKNNPEHIDYFKTRIKDFGKFINPNFKDYILIKETFNPMEIIKDTSNYNRNIILSTR
jgi:hypothetical protein